MPAAKKPSPRRRTTPRPAHRIAHRMVPRAAHEVASPPSRPPAVGGLDWLGLYLLEDVGTGDITSVPLLAGRDGEAVMVARSACVIAGLRHAIEVFARLGATATLAARVRDGASVRAGTPLLTVRGPAVAILEGERLALNIVARMSGIASAAAGLQARLRKAGSTAQVAATRKTTPGFRVFEKEAVVLGGGVAHRAGLWDEAMLKDNHLEAWSRHGLRDTAASDVAAAVQQVRQAHPGRIVTCEVESLEHALAAAKAGADWLLIDNQTPETGKAWAGKVRSRFPRVRIEASGGITPDTVVPYGWADRISLGALTQKAVAADIGLDWKAPTRKAKGKSTKGTPPKGKRVTGQTNRRKP